MSKVFAGGKKAGIKIGDRVLSVAGESPTDDTHHRLMQLLCSKPGTKVSATLERDGTTKNYGLVTEGLDPWSEDFDWEADLPPDRFRLPPTLREPSSN